MMHAIPRSKTHPLTARLGFAPGAVMRLCGMRRSGNHAIANWLQRNSPQGQAVFLNNCKPGKGPLAHFRSLELSGKRLPVKAAQGDLVAGLSKARDGALLLISYEDNVVSASGRPLSGPFDESLIDSELVVYRSFLNWSASLLKKLQGNPAYSASRRLSILLGAMDVYSDILNTAHHQQDLGVTAICYDDWKQSEPYRAGILSRLGLSVRDNALGPVQSYGGGSSFQKEAQTADDLSTDQRWQQMAANPEFQAILHVACRDTTLVDRMLPIFPQDAARLARIADHTLLPPEVLS